MAVSKHLVTGSESIRIARPRDIVIRQFEDLEHHNQYQVHKGLHWEVLEEDQESKVIRVAKRTARLYWKDDALLLHILSGAGKGGTLYHYFRSTSATETEVEMAFEIPLPPLLGFLAPFIRWTLTKDIRRGLKEDKIDLEEKGYPRAS